MRAERVAPAGVTERVFRRRVLHRPVVSPRSRGRHGRRPGGGLARDFYEVHDRIYGHSAKGPIKLVNLRAVHQAPGSPGRSRGGPGRDAPEKARGGSSLEGRAGFVEARVYERAASARRASTVRRSSSRPTPRPSSSPAGAPKSTRAATSSSPRARHNEHAEPRRSRRPDHDGGDPQQARRHRQRDGAHAAEELVLADREGRARHLREPLHGERRDARAGVRDTRASRDADPGAAA